MQEFLRWLAGLRGIEVEPGAELRLELSGFPSGGLALLILIGAVLAVAGIYLIYRRDGNLKTWQRITLASLRVMAILVALLVVLEPNLVSVKTERRDGHAIVLMDVSQSMQQRDSYRDQSVQRVREGWLQLTGKSPSEASRLELAKAALGQEDFAVLKKLNKNNRVLLYGFSGVIEPMPLVIAKGALSAPDNPQPIKPAKPQDRLPPVPDLDKLAADGRYSNLGNAIRSAVERSRGASIAAVVVLSDGRRNVGAQASEVARFLTQRKVDHTIVLPIGDPSKAKFVTVTRIEAPEKAFQKDPFKISATVSSEGYDKQTVNVRLVRVPESGTGGVVLETRPIQLGGDTAKVDLSFENLLADQAGVFIYRVEVVPPPGEVANTDRRTKQARVEVLDEQTKVLLLAGSPMHEYQILRNLLTRDRTIELACWLLSADKEFPQDGNVTLKELPKDRKELEPYDVIIMMDPDPNMLDRGFCDAVEQQVRDAGVGLWWVCGDKYALDAMKPGSSTDSLVQMLPVIPDIDKADELYKYGYTFRNEWPYLLTPEGRDAKPMRLIDSGVDEAAQVWSQLPGWHFAFPAKGVKPAARAWVETDHERYRNSRGNAPLVAVQNVGAGRVLFSASDETYRWRSLYEDEYNRYWVKGIRYLFEGRLTAGNSRLRMTLSADKLELGEPLKIVVDAKDDAYQPLIKDDYEVQIARGSQPPKSLKLQSVDAVPGQYEIVLRPAKTGFFRIAPMTKQKVPVEATFQVVAASVEKEGPSNVAELDAIAEAKGGTLLERPQQLLEAVAKVPDLSTEERFKTPHALWDSWVTIALILTLLTIEWWFRKRANLL